jgi:type II secretory pathway component GspD/PulD (secretin)
MPINRVEAHGSSEVSMCRKFSLGLILCLSFSLLQTGCAVTPPASSLPKQVTEFRQLINSDAKKTAILAREFFDVTADADERTNTMIIQGAPIDVSQAVEMVAKLETAGPDEPRSLLFIKHLKRAKARDLAPLLQDMTQQGYFSESDLFQVVPAFVADDRTNALIVKADHFQEERIREIIDDLDRPLESQ